MKALTSLSFIYSLLFSVDVNCDNMASLTNYTPTSEYENVYVGGFELLISPDVITNKLLHDNLVKRIRKQFDYIKSIKALQKKLPLFNRTRIWAELNTRPLGFAEYHPTRKWLEDNNRNPDKHYSIEITNVDNYINWSATDPVIGSVLIHEFGHVFLHTLTDEEHGLVEEVYQAAKNAGLYRNVKREGLNRHGKPFPDEDAWALADRWEYFSEITETIFGRNDYYPHTPEQLKEYDPAGYNLVTSLWSK